MMRTHLLDIVIFCLLAYAAWAGWRRGLVLELLNTLGLLVGIVAGFMLHDVVAGLLAPHIGMPGWLLKVFAFLVTTVVVFRLWSWLATTASNSFKVTSLGMADQGVGAIFGMMKMSLVLSAFFWLAGVLNMKTLGRQLADSALAADVVALGNAEFTLLSKGTPLFKKWYGEAKTYAFRLDAQDRDDAQEEEADSVRR